MRTGNHGIEVRAGKVASPSAAPPDDRLSPDPADPADPPDTSDTSTSRRVWAVAGSLALLAALVAVTAVALVRGTDDDVVKGAVPAAVLPAAPAPLTLTVTAPDGVVVGEVAVFEATWSDGSGTFSGSTEDWGDEIGTSSRKQERCEPGDALPPAAAGTYEVGHVWTAPGTYTVVLRAASYVCRDGAAVVDEATEKLTVTVLAPEDS